MLTPTVTEITRAGHAFVPVDRAGAVGSGSTGDPTRRAGGAPSSATGPSTAA